MIILSRDKGIIVMKVLNRDVIKYLAIVFMFMDHVIQIFMERGTFQYNLLDALSHFTFVTMSFFLVEGYQYTKSKKAYVKRIFMFGLISQLPYVLAFSGREGLNFVPLNIFFTLGFCFLMIFGLGRVNKAMMKVLIVVASVIICAFCDWSCFAPLFTLAFYWAKGNKKRLVIVYVFDILLFGATNISGYLVHGEYMTACIELLIATCGIILSGICIVALYNGKRMSIGRNFNKWFFYLFYPAHLLFLGVLRIIL